MSISPPATGMDRSGFVGSVGCVGCGAPVIGGESPHPLITAATAAIRIRRVVILVLVRMRFVLARGVTLLETGRRAIALNSRNARRAQNRRSTTATHKCVDATQANVCEETKAPRRATTRTSFSRSSRPVADHPQPRRDCYRGAE